MPAVHLLDPAHVDALSCVHATHSAVDLSTAQHGDAVGRMSQHLSALMGSSPEEAEAIGIAARLHDVGKISIPHAILHKPGPLTVEERHIVQRHPEAGAKILQAAKFPLMKLASQIALEHHEHADGTGYPYGLRNDAFSMPGRIVALCDVFDALRRERSYKAGMTHEEACNVLSYGDERMTPDIFDERVLDAFLKNQKHMADVFDGTAAPL